MYPSGRMACLGIGPALVEGNVLSDLASEHLREQVPMAMAFGLSAMTKECEVLVATQVLEKAQGEFLTVILDRPIGAVERTAVSNLVSILARERRPRHRPFQIAPEQLL